MSHILGKRKFGEVFISGCRENQAMHKARIIDGKRYMYRFAYLKKSEAKTAADKARKAGHLARVIPLMVWIDRAGYENGMEKVQGYVVYEHLVNKQDLNYAKVKAIHDQDVSCMRHKTRSTHCGK